MDEKHQRLKTTRQSQLVAPTAWIAGNATVLGDVQLEAYSSVWFGAVIRGDTERIQIGCRTNVQDLACLHADPGLPCLLGDDVTVGHGAIVHGARVGDRVLIGIRAVVLNGATIGSESIIAAGAVVLEGQIIPPRSLVVGVPARVVRVIQPDDMVRIMHAAEHYVAAAAAYKRMGTQADTWRADDGVE